MTASNSRTKPIGRNALISQRNGRPPGEGDTSLKAKEDATNQARLVPIEPVFLFYVLTTCPVGGDGDQLLEVVDDALGTNTLSLRHRSPLR